MALAGEEGAAAGEGPADPAQVREGERHPGPSAVAGGRLIGLRHGSISEHFRRSEERQQHSQHSRVLCRLSPHRVCRHYLDISQSY